MVGTWLSSSWVALLGLITGHEAQYVFLIASLQENGSVSFYLFDGVSPVLVCSVHCISLI
jgi:hypothetical protein